MIISEEELHLFHLMILTDLLNIHQHFQRASILARSGSALLGRRERWITGSLDARHVQRMLSASRELSCGQFLPHHCGPNFFQPVPGESAMSLANVYVGSSPQWTWQRLFARIRIGVGDRFASTAAALAIPTPTRASVSNWRTRSASPCSHRQLVHGLRDAGEILVTDESPTHQPLFVGGSPTGWWHPSRAS